MRWIALVLGCALAATYVSPAMGGPDLAGRIQRVDSREQRHYDSLDRRIKATVLLTLNHSITTREASMSLTQSPDGRFFSGHVTCGYGEHATGGGVDWGASSTYGDYHVISSSPWPNGWQASVSIGVSTTAPPTYPLVYAVCAKG